MIVWYTNVLNIFNVCCRRAKIKDIYISLLPSLLASTSHARWLFVSKGNTMQPISTFLNTTIEKKIHIRDKTGTKIAEAIFKFPNVIDRRRAFCETHKHHYDDELFALPSGRKRWMGCERCRLAETHKPLSELELLQHQNDLAEQAKENHKGKTKCEINFSTEKRGK
jgi:hypothetical protein